MSERVGEAPAGVEEGRRRRARLANIRQELLAPVSAIASYADILRDEAHRLELRGALSDLDRILAAAEALLNLVERLLDVSAAAATAAPVGRRRTESDGAVQQRLRHDLRNPLNAIVGYGEMLLEDLGDAGAPLRPDLGRLLAEASRLVADLDRIVDFSGRGGTGGDGDPAGAMIADLLRTVRPLEANEAGRPHETGKVLVVDDNPSNRELLLRRLSHEGHRVLEADSGHGALQVLKDEDVDLVLLDLIMPGMNGLEVLVRLKADDRLRQVPVIMISGLQEADSVIRCIEAGAEDYLPKPLNPVLLRARIGACLERKRWRDRERRYLARLEAEKERSETLLRNILPEQIVGRLNAGEAVIADRVEAVTILFCDLVGFTGVAARVAPARLVDDLNRLFSEFDALTRGLGIEKIKTIGDAYMAAAGLPRARPDHAEAAADLALGMLDALKRLQGTGEIPFRVRIGLHSGPVVAGVIGTYKFIYDVWGDTVNVASRLEARGSPNRIHVSERTRRLLDAAYEFESRGVVSLRGKGRMRTWFLTGRKDDARA